MDIIQRMHTAEHIFFRALQNVLTEKKQSLELDKIDLGEQESSCFVFTSALTWQDLFRAEEITNTIIAENRPVTATTIKRSALAEYKQRFPLRIKEERITEDTIRIIEIKSFDWSACNKQHCATTNEIGSFFVTHFKSLGKNKVEIRFTVEPRQWLYTYSQPTRELMTLFNTPAERLYAVIQRQREELEITKKQVRELSKHIAVTVHREPLRGCTLITAVFPGINQKEFIEKLNAEKREKTVVCFINEGEKKNIALLISDDLEYQADDLLKKIYQRSPGKGGGRKELAQGSIEYTSPEVVFSVLKELV